ncbi:MAG: hypothetical protein M3540_10990 [Actinomycetota bacterium]|nr:hypothetical protein [Actinomycetota bacterium]
MSRAVINYRWRWRLLTFWVIGFTALTVYALDQNRGLIAENKQRITDIQQSRIASCRQTYEGVRDVFRPFFRPPKERTAKERRDVEKFNRTVDRLKRRCDLQTQPGG